MRLPLKQTGFEQLNLGDRLGLGDLWGSFNLNLSKLLGTLLVSPRMLLNISTDDDAQLDEPPCAFKAFQVPTVDASYIFAVAGDFVWRSEGGHNTTFEQDGTASTPTACDSDVSDLCVAFSQLFVTQASRDIKYLNSSAVWNTISNALANSAGMHQMTYFRALNRVYIVDDSAAGISSINSSNSETNVAASTAYTLNDLVEGSSVTLGSEISCIASNTSRIGIGTINKSGNTCKFYTWDGNTGGGGTYGPNEEYNLDASGILAVIVVDDVFTVFDTKGRLCQLNGGTFKPIAFLPLGGASLKMPLSTATDRPVHYNGMSIVDGNIEILINTQLWDTNSTIKENCPSGVWCYDRTTGSFYHKRSVGLTKAGGTISDYGASKLSKVGALAEVEVITNVLTQGSINGKILLGCEYYTTATVTKSGLFYDDTADTEDKYGYFITQWIFSDNIEDTFNSMVLRIRKLINSGDKLVVKYRTDEQDSVEFTGTWTGNNSFTTTTNLLNKVGYEVTVLNGTGAGKCAHITQAILQDEVYHIALDDTFGSTSGTFKGRYQKWTKCSAEFSNQVDDTPSFSFLSAGSSPRIQIKVCFDGNNENKIFDLFLNNSKHQ